MITRPVPDLSKAPLKYKFKGAAVPPGMYTKGTPQFRYWTAAEALRRGGDFWAPLLAVKHWEPGAVLSVSLDKGVDLNAYYDRTELAFFHQKLGNVTYYSGESPDVVCHEMGHACLDAHRPQLFDALTFDSNADPTYRKYWNVPAALHAASRGNQQQLNTFLAAARHFQKYPANLLDQGGMVVQQRGDGLELRIEVDALVAQFEIGEAELGFGNPGHAFFSGRRSW